MARLRYNNALGTLGGSLTNNGTTITFAVAPAFATIVAPDYIPLVLEPPSGSAPSANFEIVYLTAYTASATTGTILRGQEGTTGVSHASAVTWAHGPFAADLNLPGLEFFLPAFNGFLAHAFPLSLLATQFVGLRPPAGRLMLMKVPLPPSGVSATNVCIDVNQSGGSLTTGQNFVGIYNSSGTLIGQSADQTANWASTQDPVQVIPLTGGPFTVTGVYCYIALLSNGSTPVGVRGLNSGLYLNLNYGQSNATLFNAYNGATSGVTSLPGSITLSSNAANNVPFWCAIT